MTRCQARPPRAADPPPLSKPPQSEDSLAPARGILAAVALAIPIWLLIALLITIGRAKMTPEPLEVLLVDDDRAVAHSLRDYLAAIGQRAIATTTADEALALIDQRPAIAVVVLDLCMPGTDGIDLARQIASTRPPDLVPEFILLTAQPSPAAAFRATRHKFHDFLEKPCRPRHLADVIDRALAAAAARRRPPLRPVRTALP